MLLKQFLDALMSTELLERDNQRLGPLRTIAKQRHWIARLIWVRIIATESNSLQHDSRIGESGGSGSHGMKQSHSPTIRMPRLEEQINSFERHFQGALYEDFVCHLRLSLRRSFLQAALYDQNNPTISRLLDQNEDLNPSKISPYSSLQNLLTHSSPLSATDLEAETPYKLDSLRYDLEYDHANMVICGWEVPALLSLPLLSLLGKEPHGCHDLIESYEDKTGIWTDALTNDDWHAKMSKVVEKVYNMVVLTGEGNSVRAATCGNIVNEWCGDDQGRIILRDLVYAASNSTRASTPSFLCDYAYHSWDILLSLECNSISTSAQ